MTYTTTIRSKLAIALGSICAVGTAWVLFWHVHSWADITTQHVMTGLSLIVTLGAGHLLWQAVDHRHWGSALSLGVLFLAGTAVCVTLSAGRGHEVLHAKVETADHENAKRLAHEARMAEANTDRKAARIAADKAVAEARQASIAASAECETGVGNLCRDKRAREASAKVEVDRREKLAQQADSHYWLLVGELASFKPAQQANIDLKRAAEVVAFIFQKDVDTTMKGIELLWPFVLALLTEFGTIAFFHYGVGHAKVAAAVRVEEKAEAPAEVATSIDPVIAALQEAGRPLGNKELADRMGVVKSTAHKRVKALNGAVRKVRKGRGVQISLVDGPRMH